MPEPTTSHSKSISRPCSTRLCSAVVLLGLLISNLCPADSLSVEVSGVKEPLLTNVQNRVNALAVSDSIRLTERRLQQMVVDIEREAGKAMRPFSYYHAEVTSKLTQLDEENWKLSLKIKKGEPVHVVSADIVVSGPGSVLPELVEWKKNWPLVSGKRLNQVTWEEQKNTALELAESKGYLTASFSRHTISADLDTNTAVLELQLETGAQAVMGEIIYEQDVVRNDILEGLPRFQSGQAYDTWLLEKFRFDVWRTGYFENVEIIEERRLEESPPVVNLLVKATARKRDTYQGSLGFGTDTGVRAQVLWTRSLLSQRGDTLEMGLGWQQTNEEYSFRSNYQLPRRDRARQFWIAEFAIRKENQDLEVRLEDTSNELVKLANGNVTDYSVKGGMLVMRDFASGYTQVAENWYGQYVLEKNSYGLLQFLPDAVVSQLNEDDLKTLRDTGSSMAFGVNWDWPAVQGSGFETTGHRERAWLFTSNEAWGSDRDFSQAYLSSNWHHMLGSKFKLLLRGEAGYSDASVAEIELELDEKIAPLSVTILPNLYRFKAGGSRSVRGYSFESLSNNGIGSNNIFTASAEVEMLFRKDWSIAAFVDTGNAFNSWNKVDLKTGIGLGLRWYSIAGAIRLDIAHPLDINDPWRLHFTIGTPLL